MNDVGKKSVASTEPQVESATCSNDEYAKIAKVAKEYATRQAFQKNNNALYQKSRRLGILDSICSHMSPSKTKVRWDRDTIKLEAQKHQSLESFELNAHGAYIAARKMQILESVSSHMEDSAAKLDEEKQAILGKLSSFKTMLDAERTDKVTYVHAKELNLFSSELSEMPLTDELTIDEAKAEAAKYPTFKALSSENPKLSKLILDLDIFSEICGDMPFK